MTPEEYERIKKTITESFIDGTDALTKELQARRAKELQESIQEVIQATAKTHALADEFAADGDPQKKKLAAYIKGTLTAGAHETTRGMLEGSAANQAAPFSESLPESPKVLPSSTPEPVSSPPKKKVGRPPKQP